MPMRTVLVLPNEKHPLLESLPHMTAAKIRKYIAHPISGGFPPEGPATWKMDQFTYRRIEAGDVVVAGGGPALTSTTTEQHQRLPHHQSHTATPKH